MNSLDGAPAPEAPSADAERLKDASEEAIDEELLAEAAAVRDIVKPNETLLVADALTGQDAVTLARNFDEKIGPHDQVYDFDGVKIIVDVKSAIYLQGTQLDYHKDLMGGNFKFVNPNANKTCGCGESFST